MRGRAASLLLALLVSLGNTGCVALLDAALRESDDHGSHARYENKDFGGHYIDALLEDDDDDDCSCGHSSCDGRHTSTVVIIHDERG
jgi:hypothetical protein